MTRYETVLWARLPCASAATTVNVCWPTVVEIGAPFAVVPVQDVTSVVASLQANAALTT